MKLQVDQDNLVVLDLERGGRIIELVLAGRLIIKGDAEDTGSGNFLLYPWVNRIEKSPFEDMDIPYKDAQGLPLHGFYVNEPRFAQKIQNHGQIRVKLIPKNTIKHVPFFSQIYTLRQGRLQLEFNVQNKEEKIPFCFGYHPYIQIDDELISDLKLSTDIKTQLKLDQRLLPIYPFERKQVIITSADKLDNLFEGGSFLQLEAQSGYTIRISSDLPYWQIYTPSDGKRIAVQPMSFCGNVYKISEAGLQPTLLKGILQILCYKTDC